MRRAKRIGTIAGGAALPLIAGGMAAALVLDLARRIFRRSRLFCPGTEPARSWDPADYGIARERVEERWLETPDGELLYAWHCRAERPVASALFCHGNSGNLTTIAGVIPHLMNAGYNVLLFDYRGFGRSTGKASLAGVVADAITAAREHDRIRPKDLPSLLYGYSLGGAVAAQVLRHHAFDGLVLQSTFTNLRDIARAAYPRLPIHLIAGPAFDTLSIVRRLNIPLLVLHGDCDETVPSWMGRAIYDACAAPRRIHIVENAMHKDLYARDPDSLIWILNQFVADLPRNAPHLTLEQPSLFDLWFDEMLRRVKRPFRRRPSPATSTLP